MHVKIVFLVMLKINFWMFVKFKVLIRNLRYFPRFVMQVPFSTFQLFVRLVDFGSPRQKFDNFAIFKAIFNPGHFS